MHWVVFHNGFSYLQSRRSLRYVTANFTAGLTLDTLVDCIRIECLVPACLDGSNRFCIKKFHYERKPHIVPVVVVYWCGAYKIINNIYLLVYFIWFMYYFIWHLQGTPVNIIVSSHVWVEDPEEAWIDGQVLKITGKDVEVQATNGKKVYGSINIQVALKICIPLPLLLDKFKYLLHPWRFVHHVR